MTYRKEPEPLGRKIIVKTDRKEGNGGKGGGRKGNTGKKATIVERDSEGKETTLAECKGSTFVDLKRKIRKTGYVPSYVQINSSGETLF